MDHEEKYGNPCYANVRRIFIKKCAIGVMINTLLASSCYPSSVVTNLKYYVSKSRVYIYIYIYIYIYPLSILCFLLSKAKLGDATQPAVANRARALHQHSLARSHIRFVRPSLDFSIISEPV
ncbi:hypothetical protein ALC62_04926 [Cyphomyrmex costatus]|uniref:Uncharacterized protein n=1 Tax=Cyphomyrmex costatus TaxID=456900 RepID=A0A195CTZ5_9HYME|nr:hypothetical protein ALC62_04926 [Cyphomyrmex costatus]